MKKAIFSNAGLVSVVFAAIAVTPAQATGGISCTGDDSRISVAIGRLPVLNVLSAKVDVGGVRWSTTPADGAEAFVFGQGMTEPGRIAVDFTDPNITRIVVSLRVDTTTDLKGSYRGILKGDAASEITVLCELE